MIFTKLKLKKNKLFQTINYSIFVTCLALFLSLQDILASLKKMMK